MPLIDIRNTNFDNGVTNRPAGTLFGSLKTFDPTRFHTYMEDFDYYTAADWTVTETQVGATQALTDADGGVLLLTNTAADNDLVALNKVGESFRFAQGAPLYFSARFSVNDATDSDLVMGLQITDTTPLDVTDGVFFLKSDGSANVSLVIEKDSNQTTIDNFITLADNTFITLGFYWDGLDSIWVGVGNSATHRVDVGSNLPDDEDLTISFAVQNGEAVAKTMSVDYIFVAKERG